jgi:membrane fusion protein, macrolide-specific efflux system
MKGKGILAAGIVILAAIAAGALSVLQRQTAQKEAAPQTQAPPAPAEITVPARLQAQTVIEVGVPIEGKIEAFHAEPGSEVYEGQLLAQIRSQSLIGEHELATLELERAQNRVNNIEGSIAAARLEASRASADAQRVRADLDRASRKYERERMLLREGATPRLVFEKAEKEFLALDAESKNLDQVAKQAEERVDTLQRELDIARKFVQDKTDDLEATKARVSAGDILSPVNGIVAGRRGQEGEDVNPTMKDLFLIATDLSTMEAVAEPSPPDLALVKPGQEAFVALAESPNELLPGIVKKVEQGKVTVEFKNPDPSIRPGLTAQVRIKLT